MRAAAYHGPRDLRVAQALLRARLPARQDPPVEEVLQLTEGPDRLPVGVTGAADMFSVFIRQSLIQLHTPDAMRGRVGAASTLAISASNELGEARSGFSAALIGPVTATVGGGILAVVVTLIWAVRFPALRHARTFDPPEPPPDGPPVVAGGV